jgi:hypothetical protein
LATREDVKRFKRSNLSAPFSEATRFLNLNETENGIVQTENTPLESQDCQENRNSSVLGCSNHVNILTEPMTVKKKSYCEIDKDNQTQGLLSSTNENQNNRAVNSKKASNILDNSLIQLYDVDNKRKLLIEKEVLNDLLQKYRHDRVFDAVAARMSEICQKLADIQEKEEPVVTDTEYSDQENGKIL